MNATDTISGVKNVTLYYTVNNGTTWEEPKPMNCSSTTGSYEAAIPAQPAGTLVRFKIVASDHAGNNATRDGTEPYCTYQVIPEFPSAMILPILMVLFVIVVVVTKKIKRGQVCG